MTQLDTVFRALAHPVRREVLRLLSQRDDGVVDVAELTAQLRDTEVADSDERLRVELRRLHLPLLRESGLVEYDPRSGAVRWRDPPPMETLVESALHSPRRPRC